MTSLPHRRRLRHECRASCTNPGFGNNCQNTPWFVLMLPFIEQGCALQFVQCLRSAPKGLGLPGITLNSTVLHDQDRVVPVP